VSSAQVWAPLIYLANDALSDDKVEFIGFDIKTVPSCAIIFDPFLSFNFFDYLCYIVSSIICFLFCPLRFSSPFSSLHLDQLIILCFSNQVIWAASLNI
jgi:hypothetical protein